MSIEVETIILSNAKSIKELFKSVSLLVTSQELMTKDLKYIGEKLSDMGSSFSKSKDKIEITEKKVDKIETDNKNKEKRWKEVKNQWAKVVGISITLATIFAASFEIIKQPPH